MAKVTMPQLGESVAEGTIGKWLKQPGDHVDKYEPLLEVITDKVNAEVPSPFEGILREILAEEGATVPNNAEIAVIETADDGVASTPSSNGTAAAAATSAPSMAAPAAPSGPAAPTNPTPAAAAVASSAPGPAPAAAVPAPAAPPRSGRDRGHRRPGCPDDSCSPPPPSRARPEPGPDRRHRRRRADHPRRRPGRGRDDPNRRHRARPRDGPDRPHPAAPAPSSARPAPAPGTTIEFPAGADEVLLPMTQMRKGIAAQMTRALQVPHAYVHMEVDATNLVKARERAKRDYQAREGISLSYVPFVIKATVDALRRYPAFNAHWTDNGLMAKRRIHMGVAVAVDDGLLVPVVRDVDGLSIAGLNRAIAEVAARARAGKLKLDDYGGSTFTIDNTGWFGSNLTMPIINVPEVAILTMEAITKRAVVLETPDGDVIAIRPVMNMVLAIDHRANDGAQAAAFLRAVKDVLEAIGPETPVY